MKRWLELHVSVCSCLRTNVYFELCPFGAGGGGGENAALERNINLANVHIFNSRHSDRLQLVISIKWFSARVNAYFRCLDAGTGLLGINPRVTQSHLEAVRFVWMSYGAGGSLHFASLILENLNNRTAFLCTQGVWGEGSHPGRILRAWKTRQREKGEWVGITMATPTTNTPNKDLLGINCTFVPSIQEKKKSKVCTLSLQCTLQHCLSLRYPFRHLCLGKLSWWNSARIIPCP